MWDGKVAQCLMQLLMVNDTRMVLANETIASNPVRMVGLRVLHQGETVPRSPLLSLSTDADDRVDDWEEGEQVVHDCVMRTISFTLVHGDTPVIDAADSLVHDPDAHGKAAKELVNHTNYWLSTKRRMIEAHTGRTLQHAYLVRIDKANNRVIEVLL